MSWIIMSHILMSTWLLLYLLLATLVILRHCQIVILFNTNERSSATQIVTPVISWLWSANEVHLSYFQSVPEWYVSFWTSLLFKVDNTFLSSAAKSWAVTCFGLGDSLHTTDFVCVRVSISLYSHVLIVGIVNSQSFMVRKFTCCWKIS